MEKIKALVRHLVLVVLVSVEGAARCRSFISGILEELSEGSEK